VSTYATADLSEDLAGLFPAGVVAMRMTEPGDASQLLAAEAACLGRAVPKRVREFAAGRVCARRALRRFGIEDFALIVGADREPLWPAGYVGSITHTDGVCAAVVADAARFLGLGIDVEQQGAVGRHLWPSICAPVEAVWLEGSPERAVDLATVIFAAKEAFYKAQFPLMRERLHFHDVAIRIPDRDADAGLFTVEPLRPLKVADRVPLPLAGRYRLGQGFVYAGIAISTPCRREKS
jgi:4'-phosphopantetheinyl transferase EntD